MNSGLSSLTNIDRQASTGVIDSSRSPKDSKVHKDSKDSATAKIRSRTPIITTVRDAETEINRIPDRETSRIQRNLNETAIAIPERDCGSCIMQSR